ncbi:MAG: hypothetical protein ACE5JL_14740, partial [Dehalococcoidia bacterium]
MRRQLEWRQERVPYFRKAEVSFLGAALVMGSLVVLVAWLLPGTDFSSNFLRKNWAALSSPWKSMETELGRVLTFLPAKKPYTIYKFGEAFPFRGTSSLGDHVAMTIRSSRPAYWRAETFDVYTPKGWLAGDRATLTEEFMPEEGVVTYRAARRVDQVIEMGITSDAVFTGGIPLYSTVGFDLEIAPPMIFTIDLDDPSQDSLLPEDLQPVAESMREEANKGALTFTDEGALRFLPEDTAINEVVRDGNRAVQIELIRLPPNPPDITAMRSHGDIRPSQLYEAISFVSLASEEALQAAGTDYPHWVTDRYLQLPDDLPDRVRGLSMGLTPDRLYDNPYDKA